MNPLQLRIFFMFGRLATSQRSSLLRCIVQSKRTCYLPIYGSCSVGVKPIEKEGTSQDPNWQKKEYISSLTPNSTVGSRDFPEGISPGETRMLELAKQRRLNEVVFCLKQGDNITSSFVAKQISIYMAQEGRVNDIKLLESACTTGVNLSAALLEAYVHCKDATNATLMLKEIDSTDEFTSPSVKQNFLSLVSENAGVDDLKKIVSDLGIIPPMHLHDRTIDNLLDSDKIEEAYKYLDFIKSLGTEPDNQIINRFILFHVAKGELDTAESLLMDMKAPARPNLDSFHQLMKATALKKDWKKTDYFLWRIGRKQLKMDRALYADLLYAFGKTGADDRVRKTLLRMRKEKLEPEIDAFNALLRGFAEAGNFAKVNAHFDELRFKQFDCDEEVPITIGQFLRPNAETYHVILNGYRMSGLYHQGIEIFRFMRGRNIQPLPETIPILQDLLEKTNSDIPIDVNEPHDISAKSKYLENAMDDSVVRSEHPIRFIYDSQSPPNMQKRKI